MLQVVDLTVSHGALQAVRQVSLRVDEGEIVVLLGANGAGKSTLFHAISGLVRPCAGRITWRGRDLTGLRAADIVAAGIAQCPEGRMLFPRLSVEKNLVLGAYPHRRDRARVARALEDVYSLFPDLYGKRHQPAGALSGGQQQMVAIGRAWMANPKLLLLDEPTLGLAPVVAEQTLAAVSDINRRGTTVLLAEQNAHAALSIAHRGYVMETGRVVLEGTREALMGDPRVKEAYLGL
ncbi:ABC transporter ATP-binding protein [Alicyclobacillus sp.]|uniref:ABC transporter ATP-binding protein n=1 Tax=Alicyclobacillus sp. TaxID=61169 RepID=UPI0025BCF628|nr:ABC transporter ATP-binding protein [Alicyclobacillus sp.]MCL6515938.1 ABC transporter ATP-binding protein [Alicyclobacillus sp.]